MSIPALALPFGAANIEGLRRGWFGDGSDGDLTLSGGLLLTRDMHYRNLRIVGPGTGLLNTAGFRIFVSGTLDLSQAAGAAIYRSGSDGAAGSGSSAGLGASSAGSQTVGGRHAGGTGGSGTSGAGAPGVSLPASTQYVFGGLASVAGAGGAGSGGAGGAAGPPPAVVPYDIRYPTAQLRRGPELVVGGVSNAGGGGGGGDGTNTGGGGGGGGSAGGVIYIAARRILRGAATAMGAIYARGGAGGAGASVGTGNRGGGGGGAGGAGGFIYIIYEQLLGSPAANALDVGGGGGGSGGNGFGTGLGGQGGRGGYAGRATLINMLTGEVRSTTDASVPPSVSVPVTVAGSAGGSRIVHLATL